MANYLSCQSVNISSIDATCDESRGGIKRVLLCPKEDVAALSVGKVEYYDYDPSSGEGTTDTISTIIPYQNTKFVEYRFRRGTGSYTSTYTADQTTGSMVVTTEVTLQFSKAENNKRMEFQKLCAHPVVMIIEDMYGKYLVLGDNTPIYLTNTVMQSGTQKSDLSGYTLTFTCEDSKFPYFVDDNNYQYLNFISNIDNLLVAPTYTKIALSQSKWEKSDGGGGIVSIDGKSVIFGQADIPTYATITLYEADNAAVDLFSHYITSDEDETGIDIPTTTVYYNIQQDTISAETLNLRVTMSDDLQNYLQIPFTEQDFPSGKNPYGIKVTYSFDGMQSEYTFNIEDVTLISA